MQIISVELGDLSAGIPRTLEEYHAKVQADNQWFYSQDAIAFRMAFNARHIFENVAFEELVRNFGLLVSLESYRTERGVPDSLKEK